VDENHHSYICESKISIAKFVDENHHTTVSDYEISLRWFTTSEIRTTYLNEWIVKMRLGGKSTTMALQKKKSAEELKH